MCTCVDVFVNISERLLYNGINVSFTQSDLQDEYPCLSVVSIKMIFYTLVKLDKLLLC